MPRLPINLPICEHQHGKERRGASKSKEGAFRKLEREWDPSPDVISAKAQNGPPRLWEEARRREGGRRASPLGAET